MSPSIIVINGLILQQLASTLFRSNYIIIGIPTWMFFFLGGGVNKNARFVIPIAYINN